MRKWDRVEHTWRITLYKPLLVGKREGVVMRHNNIVYININVYRCNPMTTDHLADSRGILQSPPLIHFPLVNGQSDYYVLLCMILHVYTK